MLDIFFPDRYDVRKKGVDYMELSQLTGLYEQYKADLMEAHKNSNYFAGWLISNAKDPRTDPCNKVFYDGVGTWVEGFLADNPDRATALAAASFILEAAAKNRKRPMYWYYLASQGYVQKLIPALSKQDCAALFDWYGKTYPRKERLPVNDELYKALKKAAK